MSRNSRHASDAYPPAGEPHNGQPPLAAQSNGTAAKVIRKGTGKTIAMAAIVALVAGLGTGVIASAIMSNTSSTTTSMGANTQQGGANTTSYDHSGTYSGALTADGTGKGAT